MTAQIESRLRKLEAAVVADSPLEGFTVAELQALRRELDELADDAPPSPLLQRAILAWRKTDDRIET